MLGERGLGLLTIGAESAALGSVATLTLALVLLLDAVRLREGELSGAGIVPMLSPGPGSFITIAIGALAASFLLGTTLVESLLLGTVLASTDPVVLRDVVRNKRIPRSVRNALSIEAGTNDVVVLPILLVLIAVANGAADGAAGWLVFAGQVFVLGPAVGFAVGAGGAWKARYPTEPAQEERSGVG